MMHFRSDEHLEVNRAHWDAQAPAWVAAGERAWRQEEPAWGIWGVPESTLQLLPADLAGVRTVELGCGTGYVSAWMARRGAIATGVDQSSVQLATARRLASEHGLEIEWLRANAEATGLPSGSFRFAVSEYGAALWCEPGAWLAEAARLLEVGGRLAFLTQHPLNRVCSPLSGADTDRTLHRPWFGGGRVDWREVAIDPGGIEFVPGLADWFAVLHGAGFRIEALHEPRPGPELQETRFHVDADWARSWPTELALVATKLA